MSRFRRRGRMSSSFSSRDAQLDDSPGKVQASVIQKARQSGRLNISNRSLTAIPDDVWDMLDPETIQKEQKGAVDLSKSGDDGWWGAVELVRFQAADNELEKIDERIGNFEALTHVDFHNNRIHSIPETFGNLKNLVHINLANNQLTQLPSLLFSLPLVELHLRGNLIKTLDADGLGQLDKLQVLDLTDNQLGTLPTSIGQLRVLGRLLLSKNKLRGALPGSLANIETLREIEATENQLDMIFDESSDHLNFRSLRQLNLRRNRLRKVAASDEAIETLSFPALSELLLSDNRLSYLGPLLTTTPHLSTLDLHQNNFSKWPEGLFTLSHLTRLDISGNDFTQLAPHLGLLRQLQSFQFEGNPLRNYPRATGTSAILKVLRTRIPAGEISTVTSFTSTSSTVTSLTATSPTATSPTATSPIVTSPIVASPTAISPTVTSPTRSIPPSPISPISPVEQQPGPRPPVLKEASSTSERQITPPTSAGPTRGHEVVEDITRAADRLELDQVAGATEESVPASSHPPNIELKINPQEFATNTLNLAKRQLSDADPSNPPTLPDLPFQPTTILLQENRFTALPLLVIPLARSLTTLHLQHNRLTAFPILPKHSFPVLRHLDISHNHISAFPSEEVVTALPMLNTLNLNRNRLRGSLPNRRLFPQLKTLQLRGNHLEEIVLACCQGLTALDLADNEIRNLPFELGLCDTLTQLSLEGNAFRVPRRQVLEQGTDEVLQWLRDRLPH